MCRRRRRIQPRRGLVPPRRFMKPLRWDVAASLALAGLLLRAPPTCAIKWKHCPSQAGAYPSELGAVSAPFIHPSHDLGVYLTDREAAASGGFPMDVDSTITVTFASLFG